MCQRLVVKKTGTEVRIGYLCHRKLIGRLEASSLKQRSRETMIPNSVLQPTPVACESPPKSDESFGFDFTETPGTLFTDTLRHVKARLVTYYLLLREHLALQHC
jgi:hypothetical protein